MDDPPSISPAPLPEPVLNPAAAALLGRATVLLDEVEAFQRSLRQANLEKTVELRSFVRQAKHEQRQLQGLAQRAPSGGGHGVHASNFPYLEAVWTHAKAAPGLVALFRPVHYAGAAGAAAVTVDIVAGHGLQWLKVSLLTPRRLLFELSRAGWEDAGYASAGSDAPLATAATPLAQQAAQLLAAARVAPWAGSATSSKVW